MMSSLAILLNIGLWVLITHVRISSAGYYSDLLLSLHKKASKQNRPLILVLDNDSNRNDRSDNQLSHVNRPDKEDLDDRINNVDLDDAKISLLDLMNNKNVNKNVWQNTEYISTKDNGNYYKIDREYDDRYRNDKNDDYKKTLDDKYLNIISKFMRDKGRYSDNLENNILKMNNNGYYMDNDRFYSNIAKKIRSLNKNIDSMEENTKIIDGNYRDNDVHSSNNGYSGEIYKSGSKHSNKYYNNGRPRTSNNKYNDIYNNRYGDDGSQDRDSKIIDLKKRDNRANKPADEDREIKKIGSHILKYPFVKSLLRISKDLTLREKEDSCASNETCAEDENVALDDPCAGDSNSCELEESTNLSTRGILQD